MIVQLLRQRQRERGYLRDEDLKAVARIAGVPLYRVEEVASFFPHFRLWPPKDVVVQVCRDMTCHLRNAAGLADCMERALEASGLDVENAFPDEAAGRPDPARDQPHPRTGTVRIEGVSCLGRCDRAPVICVSRHTGEVIHEWIYAGRSQEQFQEVVRAISRGACPDVLSIAPDTDWAHPCPPEPRAWNINYSSYGAQPYTAPYEAAKRLLRECLAERGRLGLRPDDNSPRHFVPRPLVERWLRALDAASLLGMGGAGAPAAGKWRAVSLADDDVRYVVANGDESEPGTFKDRELMLRCPELVVEGVILACLLTGATRGYVFIRHEYHEQVEAITQAIEDAVREGVCGPNILGTGRSLPVEVFVSPGGYICGEQSALLEAMEDRRAQPRNRPPDLSANGLFDRPTLVNNVETLAWAPAIFLGADGWYGAKRPKDRNVPPPEPRQGWRLFSISGDVEQPGVFEMAIDQTLGDLINRAGGVRGGKALKAVATSGPSGGFLPRELRLRHEGLEKRLKAAQEIAKSPYIPRFFDPFLGAGGDVMIDIRTFPLDLNFFRGAGSVFGLEWSEEQTGLGFPLPVNFLLGAGIVVYAEGAGVNMLDQAVNATEFFRNESCGKCVPCRIGAEKLVQIGGALSQGQGCVQDTLQLEHVLLQTSICSLGASAPKPLTTVAYFFRSDIPGYPGSDCPTWARAD